MTFAQDGNFCYHSRKDLEDENAMKIKAIQDYYERNCEKHGNGKVMATVSSSWTMAHLYTKTLGKSGCSNFAW